MGTVVQAVYDADEGVLKLDRKLDLGDQARVRVSIEPMLTGKSLARRLSGTIVIDEAVARRIVEGEELIEVE